MKRLTVAPAAEEELRAAVTRHEMQQQGLGAVLRRGGARLDLVLRHPGSGSPVPRVRAEYGTRRVPLRRFPYFVVYRERSTDIQVIAVAHVRRKPGYWRRREKSERQPSAVPESGAEERAYAGSSQLQAPVIWMSTA